MVERMVLWVTGSHSSRRNSPRVTSLRSHVDAALQAGKNGGKSGLGYLSRGESRLAALPALAGFLSSPPQAGQVFLALPSTQCRRPQLSQRWAGCGPSSSMYSQVRLLRRWPLTLVLPESCLRLFARDLHDDSTALSGQA